MIESIIAYCSKHRLLTLAVTAALSLFAWRQMSTLPIDAIPDLSDTQVIVLSRWDRSPDQVEDQVTYPIVRSLLGSPGIKTVRGFSDFGYSYVYAIFEDGTDLYWARSRVLEKLASIQGQLPPGVRTELGPDATGVGWVYQYALVDKTGKHDLAELRAIQDWDLRFHLQSVPGVAEVASLGGQLRQLQVRVDPLRLQAAGIGLLDIVEAARASNLEMGARVLEIGGAEFMIRGRGYAQEPADVGAAVLRYDAKSGAALRIRDVAEVGWGPDMRRGVADLDGEGDAPSGIVVMRHGENAVAVIDRVKARLEELKAGLPAGVEIVTVYDRSGLIRRSIDTLTTELMLQLFVVSLVILIFLWHIPSAIIPVATLPIAVLLVFIPLSWLGVSMNIMSLAGIIVAIGAMVDASIVVVENSHKRIEEWEEQGRPGGDHESVLIKAIQEVGRPGFYSLLVMGVAFFPVFALGGQEGRLFHPLAYTKNLAMLVAAVLSITLDPAMRLALFRSEPFSYSKAWLNNLLNPLLVGRTVPEEKHPVSRVLYRLYHPAVEWVLTHPAKTLGATLALMLLTVWPFLRLGSEFMPSLDEGDLLYMPTALPGLSASEASRVLQAQDAIIKSFPHVERVYGKAGRADTATDVAPFSMVETTVLLKDPKDWPEVRRWYSWLPEPLKPFFRWAWPDRQSTQELIRELDQALKFAGIPNIWTMPIRNRVDMLSTGVRTPVGVKVMGPDLKAIEAVGEQIEAVLRDVRGTRNVFSERAAGGYFLDVVWDREKLARYGLSIESAQMHLAAALGGENIGTVVRGRERYGLAVRYMADFRDHDEDIRRVLLTPGKMGSGAAPGPVALGQVAELRRLEGPSMLRNEDGRLAAYVYADVAGRDLGSYVEEAKRRVAEKVKLPAGLAIRFSGQVEEMERSRARLAWLVPITLLLIVGLLWMSSRSWTRVAIVLTAVPFSLIGAVWLLWGLDYNLSVAVWVGFIALAGLDAETGMFMLLYLEMSYDKAKEEGRMLTLADLKGAIHEGAVKRVRPKVMTVAVDFVGLFPVMLATGTGADVMKRVAAPLVGGLATSFLLELLVYPVLFYAWKKNTDLAGPQGPKGFWRLVQRIG